MRTCGRRCSPAIATPTITLCLRCARPGFTAGRLCPSRRPRRAQVVFYPAPRAAEHEGFRACRRCRPNMAKPSDPHANAVAKVCRQIEASLTEHSGAAENQTLKLSALAAAAGISAHQLERAFQRLLGITPRQYADAQRMQRLKSQLRKGDDVTTALYDAGFGSSSRLYERAPSQLGMTPATYRRGGKGMQISYTLVASPLGRLLVAATQRGISALYLGDNDAKLEAELAKEYPNAEIRRNRNGLEAGCARCSRTCVDRSRIWRSLRTCRPPLSSAGCGKNCDAYRMALRAPIPRLPARSANLRRSGR